MSIEAAATSEEPPKKLRILALDGAGIYGLTQALWLRRLCEEDDDFLAPGSIHLFAGCSAGAINSLLLAKDENPRDVVLRGELEAFWRDPGTFTNTNPVTAWLSLFGMTAWCGAEDFLRLLKQYFGDLKLHALHNHVLITTFNWSRSRGTYQKSTFSGDDCRQTWLPGGSWDPGQWLTALFGVRPDLAAARGPGSASSSLARRWSPSGPGQEGDYDSWGPNIFTNLPLTPSVIEKAGSHWSVVDVAYGAASPPGCRAIREGLSDGAQFGANPVLNAIGATIEFTKEQPAKILPRIAALSLGTGARQPFYWLESFDLSSLQFGMLPTNPWLGQWAPPTAAVFIDAPVENDNLIARQLLETSFFRLNPGILQMSAVDASMLARFPICQQWIMDQIRNAIHTAPSEKAVQAAAEFLKSDWRWKRPADTGGC